MEWMEHLLTDPALPHAFLGWLILVNSLAVFFFFLHFAARAILAAWLANLLLLDMVRANGVTSLSHMLLWTPLLAWLVWRNPAFDLRSPLGLWLVVVFASDLVAISVGYVSFFQEKTSGTPILAGL